MKLELGWWFETIREVIAAMSEKTPLPSSVVVVEVLAARGAIQFVKQIGITHSIFEGDF